MSPLDTTKVFFGEKAHSSASLEPDIEVLGD
jgi:hypothetical protein